MVIDRSEQSQSLRGHHLNQQNSSKMSIKFGSREEMKKRNDSIEQWRSIIQNAISPKNINKKMKPMHK
jgi:hypothetical protein